MKTYMNFTPVRKVKGGVTSFLHDTENCICHPMDTGILQINLMPQMKYLAKKNIYHLSYFYTKSSEHITEKEGP